MDFGVISEGPTDQIVLENILYGYCNDKNLLVKPLQPKPGESGNWDKVFRYCASTDFKEALTSAYSVDFLIVHLETDFMRRQEVPEHYRFDPQNLSPEQVAAAMRHKLIDAIGTGFYREYAHRIIFAIAVDAIECWFLPVYYPNKPMIAAKTTNCLESLNRRLAQAEGFTIHAKDEKYYRVIGKHFQKKRDLLGFADQNPSLGWFIQELEEKIPLDR